MSISPATLKIEKGCFQYGPLELQTSSLKSCWACTRTKQVSVTLLSAKGNEYRTMLIFHLETLEKVKEFMEVFVKQTTILMHFPSKSSPEYKWYSSLLTSEEITPRQCPPGTDNWPNTDHEKLERMFDVSEKTIQRVTWPNFVRTTTPSGLSEIQNWIRS